MNTSGNVNFVLPYRSPFDLGWDIGPHAMHAVTELSIAVTADLAERVTSVFGYTIIMMETPKCPPAAFSGPPSRTGLKIQYGLPTPEKVSETLQRAGARGETSVTVIFLGRNPLYPLELIAEGIKMLDQEDDVLVLGEPADGFDMSNGMEKEPFITWLATRGFRPELLTTRSTDGTWRPSIARFLRDVDALIMPVRPVRDIVSIDDWVYLSHEIEREILLKHWYPRRTYEVLKRLRRLNVIPGAGE